MMDSLIWPASQANRSATGSHPMMLYAYFDDAGTHKSSQVVVIGGLIGTDAQWDAFRPAWAAKLRAPIPGKPPLSAFHLSHCARHLGEFESYNAAEQDLITREFRQIIIDAKLISFSGAIDLKAWNELVVGPYRTKLGNALPHCVELCIYEVIRVAMPHEHGHEIAVILDQGIRTPEIEEATMRFTYPLGTPRVKVVRFEEVKKTLPLQGADIVATESYWHAGRFLKLGDDAQPRPHFKHFLDNMLAEGMILDREGIARNL
jgi:hypothetical protein